MPCSWRSRASSGSLSYALSPINRWGTAAICRCARVSSTSVDSFGEALVIRMAIGRPWLSTIATILLPLPQRVGPMRSPPFLPREGGINKRLLQAQFSACQKILAKLPQDSLQHPRALPLLKTAVTALIGTISRGKILPWSSGTQNPKNSIQHAAPVTPTSATTIRPLPKLLIPLNERPDVLPLRFIQIGHDFYLQHILIESKR